MFLNLLDNAIKYCRDGDRVVVTLSKNDAGLQCEVRDTGPGIPAARLPDVTRRFVRAAPDDVDGTGLGLPLVQEVLRRHGSVLEIDSVTDGSDTGTRAHFVLPVRAGEAAS